jgi:peptidoglycan/LPS O-acetylase OafA/YrhL
MKLQQDSDPYCMLFLGLVILTAFIFNFVYLGFGIPGASLFIAGSLSSLISGMSILMVFLLIGYFRPEKGRGKNLMFGLSVLVGLFFVIFVGFLTTEVPAVGNWQYLSFWGLGGAILTAAGFSMMHNKEESYSPGILDTSALHYGPEPPEPEPEPESEPEVEATEVEVTEPTSEETTEEVEAPSEPAPDAESE